LREPNLGKTNPRVTLFIHLRFVLHSLADSIIFLTLTRLVVVINFVNFSFALFTHLDDFHLQNQLSKCIYIHILYNNIYIVYIKRKKTSRHDERGPIN
jgi:hypothetical protein